MVVSVARACSTSQPPAPPHPVRTCAPARTLPAPCLLPSCTLPARSTAPQGSSTWPLSLGVSRYDRIVRAPAAAMATGGGEGAGAPVERCRKVGDPRPSAAPVPSAAPAIGTEGDGAEAGGGEEPVAAEGALERKRRKRREEAAAKAASKAESKARTPAAPAALAALAALAAPTVPAASPKASPRSKRPREVSALDSFFVNGPRLQPASPDVPRRSSR